MTTQTNKARPADATLPYPALHWDGDVEWRAPTRTKTLLLGLGVALLFLAASIWLLFITQDEYVIVVARTVEIPAVLFTGAGVLVGLGVLLFGAEKPAPWFQDWSYLEVLEEPDGLRLFAGRLGKDHRGVSVRRGEVIEISGSRGETLDEAELTVTTPAGSLQVEVDTLLADTTITPLEEAASRYGIEIRLSGDATEIPRSEG